MFLQASNEFVVKLLKHWKPVCGNQLQKMSPIGSFQGWSKFPQKGLRNQRNPPNKSSLVAGFNPFENYARQIGSSSLGRDEHKNIFELPPRNHLNPLRSPQAWRTPKECPVRLRMRNWGRNGSEKRTTSGKHEKSRGTKNHDTLTPWTLVILGGCPLGKTRDYKLLNYFFSGAHM